MHIRLSLFASCTLLVFAAACMDDEERCGSETCESGQICDSIALRCKEELPGRCTPGTSWQEGTPIFEEVTASWNAAGAAGTLLSVADVDGDGYPDLFVRGSLTEGDDFSEGGTRVSWLLRNEGGEGFTDITEESGIAQQRRSSGERRGRSLPLALFADLNNDGHVDVFTGTRNPDPAESPQLESSEILLGDGKGGFTLGPEDGTIRREGEEVVRTAATFLDADRDGKLDLFVANGGTKNKPAAQDQLYRGLGDGTFEEITAAAGLQTKEWQLFEDLDAALAHSNAWAAVACDVNGDGYQDLLVASYGRAPNHLWQAVPGDEIQFTNRSIESGFAFDENRDWSDNESARCFCMHTRSAPGCADLPPPRIRCEQASDGFRWNHQNDRNPFRLGGNSGTTVCADLNNDGKMDLVTTEIRHWDVGGSSDRSEILINDGGKDARFSRPGTAAMGIERTHSGITWDDGDMTAAAFDFDNDGRLDLYIGSADYPGTRGHLFWQKPDGTFQEVPLADGIDHKSSQGIVVADFNRDGALDVVVGHSRNRCSSGDHCYPTATTRFFRNSLAGKGNWIQLDLEGGPKTNRSAIGARVMVTTADGTQTQEVGGGYGLGGYQHDRVLHFGLGRSCEAEVKIRWPDRSLTTQRFVVQTGYRYKIRQGEMPKALH